MPIAGPRDTIDPPVGVQFNGSGRTSPMTAGHAAASRGETGMRRTGRAAVLLIALGGPAACLSAAQAPDIAMRHLVEDANGFAIGCASRGDACQLTLRVARADGSHIPLDGLDFDLPARPRAATMRARVDCAAAVFQTSFEVLGRLETRDADGGPRRILVVTGVPADFMRATEYRPDRESCESLTIVAR